MKNTIRFSADAEGDCNYFIDKLKIKNAVIQKDTTKTGILECFGTTSATKEDVVKVFDSWQRDACLGSSFDREVFNTMKYNDEILFAAVVESGNEWCYDTEDLRLNTPDNVQITYLTLKKEYDFYESEMNRLSNKRDDIRKQIASKYDKMSSEEYFALRDSGKLPGRTKEEAKLEEENEKQFKEVVAKRDVVEKSLREMLLKRILKVGNTIATSYNYNDYEGNYFLWDYITIQKETKKFFIVNRYAMYDNMIVSPKPYKLSKEKLIDKIDSMFLYLKYNLVNQYDANGHHHYERVIHHEAE